MFTAYSKQGNKIVPITNLNNFVDLKKIGGGVNIFDISENYLKYTMIVSWLQQNVLRLMFLLFICTHISQ